VQEKCLKITITNTATEMQWILHGRLVAPGSTNEGELEESARHSTGPKVRRESRRSDVHRQERGNDCCRPCPKQGAQFVSSDVYVKHVLGSPQRQVELVWSKYPCLRSANRKASWIPELRPPREARPRLRRSVTRATSRPGVRKTITSSENPNPKADSQRTHFSRQVCLNQPDGTNLVHIGAEKKKNIDPPMIRGS